MHAWHAHVRAAFVALHPQDVFSLGCTVAELFLDGRTVMDLGQLLGYSRGEWDPTVQVGWACKAFTDDVAGLMFK